MCPQHASEHINSPSSLPQVSAYKHPLSLKQIFSSHSNMLRGERTWLPSENHSKGGGFSGHTSHHHLYKVGRPLPLAFRGKDPSLAAGSHQDRFAAWTEKHQDGKQSTFGSYHVQLLLWYALDEYFVKLLDVQEMPSHVLFTPSPCNVHHLSFLSFWTHWSITTMHWFKCR